MDGDRAEVPLCLWPEAGDLQAGQGLLAYLWGVSPDVGALAGPPETSDDGRSPGRAAQVGGPPPGMTRGAHVLSAPGARKRNVKAREDTCHLTTAQTICSSTSSTYSMLSPQHQKAATECEAMTLAENVGILEKHTNQLISSVPWAKNVLDSIKRAQFARTHVRPLNSGKIWAVRVKVSGNGYSSGLDEVLWVSTSSYDVFNKRDPVLHERTLNA